MTLSEFRELVKHLPDDSQLLCAGGEVNLVYAIGTEPTVVSIDDGDTIFLDIGSVVLFDSTMGGIQLLPF